MADPTPRASLHTLGCRLNESETALLTDQLRNQGYRVVEFGQPCDLAILNTCSVTENAEAECRYLVRKLRRASPSAFVAVTGCYAQTGMGVLQRIEGIDLIVGTQHKMDLPRFLTSLERRPEPDVLHTRTIARDDFTLEGIGEYEETRANLKVQDGCNFMCSFCIIPFSRGHERSRHLEDLVREAEGLAARGHQEIVITGVNIGRYNQGGHSLMDVIRSLEQVTGLARVRISSIEPTTVSDELLERMAGGSKVCPYLHVPLQSGDDAILKAMNRRYSAQEYTTFIDQAVKRVPKLGLGTDVMVGFPGETDEAFERTRSLLVDLPFAYFHVFSYSPRPGTASLKLPGTVPVDTIKSRSHVLSSLSRGKRLDFYLRHVGQTVSVLFESRNKHGLFTGLTPDYMRVGISTDQDLTNQIRPVEVHGVMDGLALGALVDL